jgi:hypothetical protein
MFSHDPDISCPVMRLVDTASSTNVGEIICKVKFFNATYKHTKSNESVLVDPYRRDSHISSGSEEHSELFLYIQKSTCFGTMGARMHS